jgi:hypothetical protein
MRYINLFSVSMKRLFSCEKIVVWLPKRKIFWNIFCVRVCMCGSICTLCAKVNTHIYAHAKCVSCCFLKVFVWSHKNIHYFYVWKPSVHMLLPYGAHTHAYMNAHNKFILLCVFVCVCVCMFYGWRLYVNCTHMGSRVWSSYQNDFWLFKCVIAKLLKNALVAFFFLLDVAHFSWLSFTKMIHREY